MNLNPFTARASFQVKVLVPVVAVMVLLMAVTISLVNGRISAQLHRQSVEELNTAGNIFKFIQQKQSENLVSRYSDVRNEPRFRAVTGTSDFNTIRTHLDDYISKLIDSDGALIATFTSLGNDEQRVATANRDPQGLDSAEFQARSALAVREAAKGSPKTDTVCLGRRLFHLIAIPVGDVGQVSGVLTFGVEVGTNETMELKRVSRSEILFLSDGQVVASSLSNSDWFPQLAGRFKELSLSNAPSTRNRNSEIILDREHYLCQSGYFDTLNNDSHLGYLLLSSYEQPYGVLRATQQQVLAVGLLGIVAGIGVIWLLVGRVTRPLRQLRDSAEAVGQGDFSKRVEVTSGDECGKLAAVFNHMTENLQASRQELEKTVDTLKSTQNQLIQSEKLSGIGEFVAGVAHELNNPLTSVMGFAELLQQADLPEQPRRYLEVISKSAKRCQKIVSSLLSFARRHAPERKVLCVNEIVDSAVEILQYQMRTSNIEVVTQLDPDLPATELDPHQMQQVFLNIINNARQAMEGRKEKGRLQISTESSNERVRISFKDNGPGIAPENLKKIFNPFFTTKEVGKGTGLGLSLCYGIVSEHGGSITPYSPEGEGATFVIELPVTHAAATAEKKASVPLPAANRREGIGKRVLVIDDEDSILQMIREALIRNGYRVDIARDGEAGLQRLGQCHYDLALCDWKMPGLNGQQIYERLRESNPEMSRRMIFITGDIVNEKTQEFLKAEQKVCLSKPFTLVEFRSAINRVVAPGTEN